MEEYLECKEKCNFWNRCPVLNRTECPLIQLQNAADKVVDARMVLWNLNMKEMVNMASVGQSHPELN